MREVLGAATPFRYNDTGFDAGRAYVAKDSHPGDRQAAMEAYFERRARRAFRRTGQHDVMEGEHEPIASRLDSPNVGSVGLRADGQRGDAGRHRAGGDIIVVIFK